MAGKALGCYHCDRTFATVAEIEAHEREAHGMRLLSCQPGYLEKYGKRTHKDCRGFGGPAHVPCACACHTTKAR